MVCFDTYARVDAFVQAVTTAVPAKMRDYDDGVWFVLADDRTWPAVPELVERFGIEPYADLASFLRGGPKAARGGGPGYGRRSRCPRKKAGPGWLPGPKDFAPETPEVAGPKPGAGANLARRPPVAQGRFSAAIGLCRLHPDASPRARGSPPPFSGGSIRGSPSPAFMASGSCTGVVMDWPQFGCNN